MTVGILGIGRVRATAKYDRLSFRIAIVIQMCA